MIRLECESFAYDDGAPVLAGLDFAVGAGEALTVVGASGSGKSTVARLLAGQTGRNSGARFCGSLVLDGDRVDFSGGNTDPRIDLSAWGIRVGYVSQHAGAQLSLMSGSVAEEIAFGPANRGVPAAQIRGLVNETAEQMNVSELLDRDPRHLSGGQLQKVIIAAAVVCSPRLMVLDEPFRGLDAEARDEVAVLLSKLQSNGTALAVFESMLPVSDEFGSRFLALADGREVFTGSWPEATQAGLIRYGIGRRGIKPDGGGTGASGPGVCPDTAVRATDVRFAYPGQDPSASPAALDGIRLTVHRGEAVALLGANGSGKSTLLQHVNGLLRPTRGDVELLERPIGRRVTGELASLVGYLFQDTDQQLFERTVLREVEFGPSAVGFSRSDARRKALEALETLQLVGHAEVHPHDLGFARRRLVALASMLATGPVIWALDEPTAGLDAWSQTLMAAAIRGHLNDGGTVIMATHDQAFAEAVCSRALILDGGRISGHQVFAG